MSGRNLRNFITQHRSDSAGKLTMRMKEGVGSNKYQPVDYDQLRAIAAKKKLAGQESLIKVKKLQEASRQGKEQQTLKQHKLVWNRELLRLNTLRRRLESEIDSDLVQNMDAPLVGNIYAQFHAYDCSMNREFEKFKKETVEPVWNLREDLQFVLEDKHGSRSNTPDGQQGISQAVSSVKQQQQHLLDQLQREQRSLEQDLSMGCLEECSKVQERTVQTGIPSEAFDLPCPDQRLKATVLQDFILLDAKHLERLEELEDKHADLTMSDCGGWDSEDHFVFTYIMEQYPTHQVSNRRPLYLDRMKRHLPHKKRDDIVGHEDWWTNYKYYQKRRHAITTDWIRDRAELLNRARVVFAEAIYTYNDAAMKAEERGKQQHICDHLHEKMSEWRDKKMEAMKLEEALEADRQKDILLRKEEEEAREKERRDLDKQKLLQYHERCEAKRQVEREEQQQRLDELNKQLAEQAALDKQRVEYRQEVQKEKDEERKRAEEEMKAEVEEREDRLEALRQQVRPTHVERDLLRLWSDTECIKARQTEEENIEIQKPLYSVNTFTAKQVTADPRFRFANSLRDAGLEKSEYARKVFSEMQPLHPPRRDMESTVFKQT